MPKLELKTVQGELEKGLIWPFYWIYGPEKMKSRELLKRIRAAVLGKPAGESQESTSEWAEESFDGTGLDAVVVLDSLLSPSLYSKVKLVVVRDAHALKNVESFAELLGPPQTRSQLNGVCVCLAKDLDGRKKFSKVLLESAAVVPCEEVPEAQKTAWIQFLAKRQGLELSPSLALRLYSLEPWSLDIVDQELVKFSVAGSEDVVLGSSTVSGGSDAFLDSFFQRELKNALPHVSCFAESPESALPLLGLFGWNVRQLALFLIDRENGTRHAKLNPYVMDRFRKWSSHWKLAEVIELQNELSQIDFSIKQTPLVPLGLWTGLVVRFCG